MTLKLLTLAVFGIASFAATSATAKQRPYSGFSEQFLEQARQQARDEDGLLLKCTYDTKCVGEICGAFVAHSELMLTYVSKSEGVDEIFPETSTLRGVWFGPDDSSDTTVVTNDGNLTGMIFGMGDGVALFSSSVNGGKGVYSFHSNHEIQVTTYFGACERQK